MKLFDHIMLGILIFAGVNYGLEGLFNFNVVTQIFGDSSQLATKVVYVIFTIAALWCIKYFKYRPGGYRRNKDKFI